MTSIKDVFENKLKIDSKTVSIDSLFNNKDKLKNTNYKPFYQRNYVWDDEKATYFIESILLGTEIPPLIYFRNISKVEIIDGRQRYQTILRFINNDFKLKRSGLKKLSNKDFIGKSFESLDKKYTDLIWETKLRVIEFSFNTKDGITEVIEDSVKKEIFKRYNSGITPLKTNEIDKAEFLYDDLNQYLKNEIISDKRIFEVLRYLFHFEKFNEEVLLKKIRELLVIDYIPIKYYSVKKSNVINQFYEYLYDNIENIDLEDLRNVFITKINILENIYKNIKNQEEYNRLISECVFWALSIFYKENNHLNIPKNDIVKISNYIDRNIDSYKMDRSSFAIHIKNRYENISKIFHMLYGINFNVYLKDSIDFNDQLNSINITQDNTEVISFEDLRINKPEPSSISIDDIIRSMKRQKFIIRPQYQRNEVIDKKKASSIIESILLGIKIPPIFVYKNDGVSEVIDGQQRLLTILGFLGEDFINTENEFESTKKDYYSLNLKNGILSGLNSSKFDDLSEEYQEKIKNYDLWVVEIDSKYNEKFDPVDLFIRLNYKPYPIKIDSFEMWNSYISRDLIDTIKDVYNNNKDWFYFRKTTTRMENENILTALIYLQYQFTNSNDASKSYEALDYYKVGNKINFRLRSKPDLTRVLEHEPKRLVYMSNIFEAVFIKKLKLLITHVGQKNLALSLDYLLCVDNGRRTQQSLYALWYFVNEINITNVISNGINIVTDIRSLFNQMNNVKSTEEFNASVKEFKLKHSVRTTEGFIRKIKLESILNINKGIDKDLIFPILKTEKGTEFLKDCKSFENIIKIEKSKILGEDEDLKGLKKIFEVEKIALNHLKSLENYDLFWDKENRYINEDFFILSFKRGGFSYEYLYLFLSSKALFNLNDFTNKKLNKTQLSEIELPILSADYQIFFKNFYKLIINESNSSIKTYFINVINNIVKFFLLSETYEIESINILNILDILNREFENNRSSEDIYIKISSNDSQISSFILRMNYLLTNDEKNN
ncbi:Protein of unknown function DUF262 [Paenimyroides ummariense]|uniref:GmrSD restriction endonucleases N-terminal domain-containing protein n=1 Tax=Paenimyroides ummariense TaxID=913024 RepID=A0A1I5CUG7_9FLAO|nr:DUF262 domain-containing protein [Paenimyroides ummariense]SFN90635.1 Protein of unknown function DUF262 [Paenimyroides ummariense]